LEALESRVVPYATTGNAWPSPQLITISFVPDGTIISTSGTSLVGSNLFSKFNTRFGSPATWQNVILKAAQGWAAQTNINFAVVPDDGVAFGTGPDQQGDPNHGDIRIGGYVYGSYTLATAYMPPPANNYDAAGDIKFNTGQYFNIGSTYDLYSVAAHEFGHALGLGHSTYYTALMYGAYDGAKPGPSSDDIAGIRAIYSNGNPRTGDGNPNNSISTARDLTSQVDPINLTATLTGVDITTTSDVDYYTVTTPALTSSTLTVGVQSQGLSLLSPKVTVYAADGVTVLGSAGTSGQYGATLSVTVSNVVAGSQYYVKVTGADNSVFGTGAYALTLNFGTGPSPTVPLPNTTLANDPNTHGGGGIPEVTGDDSHVDAFPDPDARTVTVVSVKPSSPTAATPDAGTVSILSAATQVRSAAPTYYAAPSAEQFSPRAYVPSVAELGATGAPSGTGRLSGTTVIDVSPGEKVEDDAAAPEKEKSQPVPQGESNPAPAVTPAHSEAHEALLAAAVASITADEVQAADALFTTAEPLPLHPADSAGDAVQGGGSALLLFGEAVMLAALQSSYRAEADRSRPEEEARKPRLTLRS
jgi:hypothetical protein